VLSLSLSLSLPLALSRRCTSTATAAALALQNCIAPLPSFPPSPPYFARQHLRPNFANSFGSFPEYPGIIATNQKSARARARARGQIIAVSLNIERSMGKREGDAAIVLLRYRDRGRVRNGTRTSAASATRYECGIYRDPLTARKGQRFH